MAPRGRREAQGATNRASGASGASPRARVAALARTGFVLRMVEGAQVGLEYAFERQATIGRTDENDIVLVEPGLSRRHLRIYDSHGAYVLEDLGSANGTRLNGERVAGLEVLREGDHITLAQSTFRFSLITPPLGEPTQQVRFTGSQLRRLDVSSVRKAGAGERWWRRRGAWLALAALALLGGGLAAWLLLRAGGTLLQRADRSDEPVTYADDEIFFRSVFGYGETDRAHRSRLIVRFRHLAGRVTLEYGAWGVDKLGELVIELNGKPVGEVPLTLMRWTYGLKLVLPATLLQRGENTLVFRNTREPSEDERWEICFLQLRQEVLPPPDAAQARRLFELGRQAWNERDIEPSNMSTALTRFRRARDLLEGLRERPAIYLEALDYIDKVDKALTVRFQEGLFSAQRAMRVEGDRASARALIAHTLRHFARDDYRYRELTRLLDALGEE
ncbi:MAG: FHA domain-containing protein [Proteobacteria bacterium]|nr:FHA domain-containing protein [Pseudomonadota bacterium]